MDGSEKSGRSTFASENDATKLIQIHMKKFLRLLSFLMAITAVTLVQSCSEDEPAPDDNTDELTALEGNLTTQTLDASKVYLLKNQVFIPDGVTLTIPAGTIIKGDRKAVLVVKPGGKLMANGTSTNPVIFTSKVEAGSRERGYWAGIVILGKAFVNQPGQVAIEGISPAVFYGAKYLDATATVDFNTNATDNSGSLTYVRIEYAGVELTPNNETNGLTMGGVGSGTVISNVQVSYGGDDGFEWFGGTVNAKNLISYNTWDDDFDTDFGWRGKVQYGLIVRYPTAADQSESNAFESDSQGNGNEIFSNGATGTAWCTNSERGGCTSGVFSNITVLGPRKFNARALSNNYKNAMHIRRRSSISIFNSYFSGFRIGMRVDDAGTLANITSGNAVFANNVLAVPGTVVIAAPAATAPADASFATGLTLDDAGVVGNGAAGNAAFLRDTWNATNTTMNGSPAWTAEANPYAGLGINANWYWGANDANAYVAPNFSVTSGTLATGAAFTNAKVSSGFDVVTYRGAFGATNWTTGWAEFNPQNQAY